MKNEKEIPLEWFLITFKPLTFVEITFLENYDRYEPETFRVH